MDRFKSLLLRIPFAEIRVPKSHARGVSRQFPLEVPGRVSCLFLAVSLFFCTVCRIQAQCDAPLNPGFDLGLMVDPARCGLDGEVFDPFYREAVSSRDRRKTSQNVSINYKNQINQAFSNNSLKILSAAYQCRFFRERMALGVHAYSNTLYSQAMQDFQIMFTYAYHWTIVADLEGIPLHRLSFALQAGYRNYGYRTGNMQTGSMYDPSYVGGFNPSLLPFDQLPEPRHLADGNFGMQYSGIFDSRWRLDAGFSAFHLFRPKTGVLDENYRVPLRFSAYASATVGLSEKGSELGFVFYYSYQADNSADNVLSAFYGGLSYRYVLAPGYALGGSLYFRSERTFIPQLTIDLARFTLMFQMEFNTNYSFNNLFSIGLAYRW